MNDPKELIDICANLVQDLTLRPDWPEKGTTHCNEFVDRALEQWLGNNVIGAEFHGLMANAIVDKLAKDPAWDCFEVEDIATAHHSLIEAGFPAIAGEKESGHGHVNIVIAGAPVPSGHWNCLVPLCANVGRDNFIGKGLNFAFVVKPKIWVRVR